MHLTPTQERAVKKSKRIRVDGLVPEPAMTGTFVHDWGDAPAAPQRFEVRFAFEGETWFAEAAMAAAAACEYERIVADCVEERTRREARYTTSAGYSRRQLIGMVAALRGAIHDFLRHPLQHPTMDPEDVADARKLYELTTFDAAPDDLLAGGFDKSWWVDTGVPTRAEASAAFHDGQEHRPPPGLGLRTEDVADYDASRPKVALGRDDGDT